MVNRILNEYGKIPPQAIDLEEAVLGALMIESGLFYLIANILNDISFYKDSHQIIFNAIKELDRQNSPIDILTVIDQLRKTGQIDDVGGVVYISQLTSKIGSGSHIEYHAKIIQQKFIQREIIRVSSEIQNQAFDDSIDPNDLFSFADMALGEIMNSLIDSNIGQSTKDVLKEAIKEVEQDCINVKSGKPTGISTGFKSLDEYIGGWRNGELSILASRPGIGKTSIGLHFSTVAAKTVNVLFFSFEMKKTNLVKILISANSGIYRSKLRDGLLNDYDWTQLQLCLPNLDKLPIIWVDKGGLNVNQIKTTIRKYRRMNRCDLVIIDYLQLIKPVDRKVIREQQISEISRVLKEITLNENIPIIALSQLNREADEAQPRPSHLRESGALEQDADNIIFPWRPGYNAQTSEGEVIPENEIKMIISKARNGKRGDFKIIANGEMTKFSEDKAATLFSKDFTEPKEPF